MVARVPAEVPPAAATEAPQGEPSRAAEVLLRSVGGDLRQSFALASSVVTHAELCELAEREWGWRAPTLVHEGRVLQPGEELDLRGRASVVVVVPRRPFADAARAAQVEHELALEEQHARGLERERDEAAQRAQRDGAAEGGGRTCRICLAGEDPDEPCGASERLFSPCRCRGTMKYVHRSCLDGWRAHQAGQRAYYRCDQCSFEYRLQRTAVAGLLESLSQHSGSLAVLLVAALVSAAAELARALEFTEAVVAYAGHYVAGHGEVDLAVARVAERLVAPDVAHHWLAGLLAVGAGGAGLYVAHNAYAIWTLRGHVNWVDEAWENPNALILAATLFTHSANQLSRSALGVGLLYCVTQAVVALRHALGRLLTRLAEEVLEVPEDAAAAPLRRPTPAPRDER
jgi:hypothetical protein